jgi:hypothetical protein
VSAGPEGTRLHRALFGSALVTSIPVQGSALDIRGFGLSIVRTASCWLPRARVGRTSLLGDGPFTNRVSSTSLKPPTVGAARFSSSPSRRAR